MLAQALVLADGRRGCALAWSWCSRAPRPAGRRSEVHTSLVGATPECVLVCRRDRVGNLERRSRRRLGLRAGLRHRWLRHRQTTGPGRQWSNGSLVPGRSVCGHVVHVTGARTDAWRGGWRVRVLSLEFRAYARQGVLPRLWFAREPALLRSPTRRHVWPHETPSRGSAAYGRRSPLGRRPIDASLYGRCRISQALRPSAPRRRIDSNPRGLVVTLSSPGSHVGVWLATVSGIGGLASPGRDRLPCPARSSDRRGQPRRASRVVCEDPDVGHSFPTQGPDRRPGGLAKPVVVADHGAIA